MKVASRDIAVFEVSTGGEEPSVNVLAFSDTDPGALEQNLYMFPRGEVGEITIASVRYTFQFLGTIVQYQRVQRHPCSVCRNQQDGDSTFAYLVHGLLNIECISTEEVFDLDSEYAQKLFRAIVGAFADQLTCEFCENERKVRIL